MFILGDSVFIIQLACFYCLPINIKFLYCIHMCPLATEMQDLRNNINLPEGTAAGRILNCCYYF